METTPRKRQRGRPRAFDPDPSATTIQALDRALIILDALAGADGLSLSELAETTGQSPATVYRVLCTFAAHGMVEQEPASQLWFIGQAAFRIGSAFLGRSDLVEAARGEMRALMAETGETANLAIADGGEVIFLSQVETHEPIRAFFRPGTRGPIHASGIGKALLAQYPPERVARIVAAQGLPVFTPRTIAEPEHLARELAAIRARGFAIDDGEHTAGMRCVAAPVFDGTREAVAGVSISGPTARMAARGDAVLGARVHAAADRITRAIGGTAPARSAIRGDPTPHPAADT